MKLIRIVVSTTVLVLIVCAIAISALMIFINPNKLKPIIAAELNKQTGYQAVIDGRFSWTFYPSLGVKVEHIALSVPKQSKPFIDLHDVTFKTALTDLIKGNQKVEGDIYIAKLTVLNVEAQHAHVGMHWQNQILTLDPIKADLYDGSLVGVAHGSGLSGQPSWDWNMTLANIQLLPLLQDVNGADSKLKISGIGDLKLSGSAQGKSREEVLNSLNGLMTFGLRNGVVQGVDLNYLVRSADALINKQPLTAPETISETNFDSFAGSAIIKNGVAVTNDLSLTSPALTLTGAGSVNLILQAVNMQLRIAPQKNLTTHWVIPVLVSGNVTRPDVRLDATELNIMVAKEKLDKVKNKVRQEIKEHISGKAGDVLQSLLGK